MMIEKNHDQLSIHRQCGLLDLSPSTFYYQPRPVSSSRKEIMHEMDEIYTQQPFYGSRRMQHALLEKGYYVSRKQVQSFYREMGLKALYPKPKTTVANPEHKKYPYLLRDVKIDHVHHVYSTDITYIRLVTGFVYLVAIIDWFSRYVLAWSLSPSLEADFCVDILSDVLASGYRCDIFNSDQGTQFTCSAFTNILLAHDIKISMDGRGRALDNIFIERLWRSVKYECVYLHAWSTIQEARAGLEKYFNFYNHKRPHQSLDYKTPLEVFRGNHDSVIRH